MGLHCLEKLAVKWTKHYHITSYPVLQATVFVWSFFVTSKILCSGRWFDHTDSVIPAVTAVIHCDAHFAR